MKKYKLFSIILILISFNLNSFSQWKSLGPNNSVSIHDFTKYDSCLVAFTEEGEFISTNSGANWLYNGAQYVFSTASNDTYFYLYGEGGVFRSSDKGRNWYECLGVTQSGDLLGGLYVKDNYCLAPYSKAGVYISTDKGNNWKSPALNNSVNNSILACMSGNSIIAATSNALYKSTDLGNSWVIKSNSSAPSAICSFDSTILVSCNKSIILSNDAGESWSTVNVSEGIISTFSVDNNIVYAGDTYGQIFVSNDKGKSWSKLKRAFTSTVKKLIVEGSNIYCGTTAQGLYKSTDSGNTWNSSYGLSYVNINAIGVTNSIKLIAIPNLGVYYSSNNGSSWNSSSSFLKDYSISSFLAKENIIFAGTKGAGVVCSSLNSPSSWNKMNVGLNDLNVNVLARSNNSIIAGTSTNLFVSDNDGNQWTVLGDIASELKIQVSVSSIVIKDSTFIIGTNNYGVLKSTDNGKKWTFCNTGITTNNIKYMAATDLFVFAASDSNLYASDDNGKSWKKLNSVDLSITSLAAINNTLFIGDLNKGLIWYNDQQLQPDKFLYENTAWKNSSIKAIGVFDNAIYVGTSGSGLLERSINDFVTSIQSKTANTPCGYLLSQNYPNPFNPSTTIAFSVPKETHVTLRIYDILGREITTLVNEKLQAGSYSKVWNATGYSSGVYFYRIEAGEFTETKKINLLK